MTDPVTTNYGWTLPTVGADANTWGTLNNANWSSADATVKAVSDAALPLAGGTATGAIAAPTFNAATDSSGVGFNVIGRASDGAGVIRYLNHAATSELLRIDVNGAGVVTVTNLSGHGFTMAANGNVTFTGSIFAANFP